MFYFDPYAAEKKEIRRASNRSSWTVLIALFSMSLLVSIPMLIQQMANPFNAGKDFSGLDPILYYGLNGLAYLVGIFLPFFLFMKLAHMPEKETLPFQKVRPLTFICLVFMGWGVCMAANYPANLMASFLESIGLSGTLPSDPAVSGLPANIMKIIGIAVIPPLTEEFAFRGVILSKFRKYGDGFAIVASSILFGIYHGNLIQAPFAICVGLILGFIAVKTKCLWIPIIIHALNNGLSVALEYANQSFDENTSNMIYLITFAGIILLGVIAFLILFCTDRKLFAEPEEGGRLSSSSRVAALVGNPGFIAILVYFAGTSALFLTL